MPLSYDELQEFAKAVHTIRLDAHAVGIISIHIPTTEEVWVVWGEEEFAKVVQASRVVPKLERLLPGDAKRFTTRGEFVVDNVRHYGYMQEATVAKLPAPPKDAA